ncbi:BLUF domain-containing protein [Labilibaculum sp. DW002]|uniref:BLUF domain-containing protein n=1 Tax=Paralabilibaculum antarcticum TaxID=2912572 RepID=A0ABT5VNB0_9BACT|nr:BLUF domain-containing protein [Labilibaculum sp. DW002]MDE5416932.1 BLUF domain-containing protein [Labilibaculum sp. DW002]
MSKLIHIVYLSVSKQELSEKELADFLSVIRAKNKKLQVSGLLLYNEGMFIQVVEGEKKTVQNLFQNVKNDSRHSNIVKLLEEDIAKRSFPDWSMGFKIISNKETENIPGFSDLLKEEISSEPMPGIAEQVVILLNSFRRYI